VKNSVVIAVCALAFGTAGSAYGQPVTNPPYEITGTDPTGATYTYLWGWYLSSFYITDNAVEGDLVGCGAAGVQVMLPSLNVPAPRRPNAPIIITMVPEIPKYVSLRPPNFSWKWGTPMLGFYKPCVDSVWHDVQYALHFDAPEAGVSLNYGCQAPIHDPNGFWYMPTTQQTVQYATTGTKTVTMAYYFCDAGVETGDIGGRYSLQFAVSDPLTITGPNVVWSFAGLSPSGYATAITLTSSGGTSTTWSLVSGSGKATLSATQGTQTTVTSTGTSFSAAVGDIIVRASNAGETADQSITSRTPYSLLAGNSLTNCDATWGYDTFLAYTIRDQLGTALPLGVPINEQWTTAVVKDNKKTNWPRGNPGSFTTTDATFADHIQGALLSSSPVPVPSCTGTTANVEHWGQAWYIGSLTIGAGKNVQTNVLQKRVKDALHTTIVSPVP